MSTVNRYQVLSDDEPIEDSGGTMPGILEDALMDDSKIASKPEEGNQQEGWDEDFDDIESVSSASDEYSGEQAAGQSPDQERRRKVSQGQREAPRQYQTIGFDPKQMKTWTPKDHKAGALGRGGGVSIATTSDRLCQLTTIAEGTEVETEVGNDPQSIMRASKPPPEEVEDSQQTFFTYRAQLTFGLEKGSKVHLPDLFREWVKNSNKHIPNFTLLPFDDPKGHVICLPDQIPEDTPSFFKEYYHNHWVLPHGNLTGMVHIRCSVTWNKIKRVQDDYFQYLHWNKVYLNLTKFKADTLVVCGFFVGAHPGHLRREDAEVELRKRLQLPPDFPFQLSSRTISVPIAPGKDERYAFPAVAVESSTKFAKRLREAFFAQPKPSEAKLQFPYTGMYQFVPVIQSKEWPISKIFQLAKVHTKICQNLKVVYLENLQDIRNVIGTEGQLLMRGFLGMVTTTDFGTVQLIQSIHNTGRNGIKAALVPKEHYEAALEHFATLHQQLLSGVNPEYHKKVFIGNQEAGLTSMHRDTVQSCNSSHYANELLQIYNPQDPEGEQPDQTNKRFRPSVISYAAAVSSSTPVDLQPSTLSQTTSQGPNTQVRTAVSSLTTEELDQLYERLKHHTGVTDDSHGVSSDDLEKAVEESNKTIMQVREEMRLSVEELSTNVAKIEKAVLKQNGVVLGISKTLEATSQDIKTSVDLKFNDLSQQIQELRSLMSSLLPSPALQAVTQLGGQFPG